jgi:hypothetical protein
MTVPAQKMNIHLIAEDIMEPLDQPCGDRHAANLKLRSALPASNSSTAGPDSCVVREDPRCFTTFWNLTSDRGPYFQATFSDSSKITGSVGQLAEPLT